MERLIYWVKKCLKGNSKYCRSFCVTCPYYDRCKDDDGLD